MSSDKPLVMGVCGIGGYAKVVIDSIRQHGPNTDPVVRLAAVCDPFLDRHGERVAAARGRGGEGAREL